MPPGVASFLEFETGIVQQVADQDQTSKVHLEDVPLMFSVDRHRRHGFRSDEYQNTFNHHLMNTTIPVKFKKGHLYVEWPTAEVLFARMDLRCFLLLSRM